MNTKISVLILSPHIDDEVLGCFSFLNQEAFVLYIGAEERETISKATRMDELNASADALGFQWELKNHTVNQYISHELIELFEITIARLKPETVLIPVQSYNQDHRAVYEAALVATRPHDTNFRVDQVLAFEQPHSELWPYQTLPKPALHRPIDIEHKLTAYQRYSSQVRGHRSPETVAAMAAMRGAEIGEPHAEAFHILRRIEQ